MNPKIKTTLLRQLSAHLKAGRLHHDKFFFGDYSIARVSGEGFARTCETLGCAIGECPEVFPECWAFEPRDDEFDSPFHPQILPRLRATGLSPLDSAGKFFGITHPMVQHLFVPRSQRDLTHPYPFGPESVELQWTKQLRAASSKEAVADNIDAFCDWAESRGLAA